jgi:hypothetical protein
MVAMSAADIGLQLEDLTAERRAALAAGLADNATYMADLEHEISAVRAAYVGQAVTEIAALRAVLSGPQEG